MVDEVVTQIIVDARGAIVSTADYKAVLERTLPVVDQSTVAQGKLKAATEAAGDAAAVTGTKLAQSGRDFSSAERNLNSYLAKLDPVYGATQRLATEQRGLEGALRTLEGQLLRGQGLDTYSSKSQLLRSRMDEVKGAAAGLAAGTISAEKAMATLGQQAEQGVAPKVANASQAVRQFGVQSIDVFQQLATGAPIMTTFIQQGAQVGQVAANAGVGLGQLARGVGSVLLANAGIIAATAGMAAFGIAIYSVASRSADLEAQQKTLAIAIQGVGRSADTSVGQLRGYVDQLKLQGVAAQDAVAAVAELARNTNLSSPMAGRILGLAPDAAAALGTDMKDAIKRMSEAATGGVQDVLKLSDAFNLLNSTETVNIRSMIEHGEKAAALDIVFTKLKERVNGLESESLTPSARAMRDLSLAWDGFMTRVANSEPVMKVIAQLARDIRSISNVISGGVSANTGMDLSAEIASENKRLAQLQADQAAAQGATSRLQQEQFKSRQAEIENLRVKIEALIAKARAEVKSLPADPAAVYGPPMPTATDTAGQRDLERTVDQRFSASTQGQIAKYREEITKMKTELKTLGPVNAENAEYSNRLTIAIQANEKAIDDLNKKNEVHRTGQQKAIDTVNAEIKAQEELGAAYRKGETAVAEILARQEAEKKVISDGLTPGTRDYTKAVDDLTAALLRKKTATGQADIEKTIAETDRQTDAQLRIAAAYDGTAESLFRAQNLERAQADALKANLVPGTADYATQVERLAAAYDRSSTATADFQQVQQSVQALTNSLSNAFDRLGQGIVDAFLAGRGAAVNFGNIARGIAASLLTDFAKLAIAGPIKNAISGTNSAATLSSALGALGGGSESANGGGGMGSLLNQGSNLLSLGKIADSLGLSDIGGQISRLTDGIGLTGEGGLFGGAGSGISNLLSTGVNGVSQAAAFDAAIAQMGSGAGASFGPVSPAQMLAQQGGGTFGGILGGVGAGFTVGSMAGGFLQSSLGKVGPAPTIGAGLGAGVGALATLIPGVGAIIGPLLAGILGGAGGGLLGGLIGPNKPSLYSSTGIGVTDAGTLSLGKTYSQLADTAEEVKSLGNEIASLNQILSQTGTKIANGSSSDGTTNRLIDAATGKWLQIGQNTPDGTPDPSKYSSLASAFPGLRFAVTGAGAEGANRVLQDRSFASGDEFNAFVTGFRTFMDQTLPQLTAVLGDAGDTTNQYQAQLDALNKSYTDAIAKAGEYGQETTKLAEAQVKATQDLTDSRNAELEAIKAQIGYGTANDNEGALAGQLKQIDLAAAAAIKNLRSQLGSLGASSEDTAGMVAKLTETLADQRTAAEVTLRKQIDLVDATDGLGAAFSQIRTYLTGFNTSIDARLATVAGDTNRATLISFDQQAAGQMTSLLDELRQLNASSAQIETATGKLADAQQRERDAILSQQALASFSLQEDTKFNYGNRLMRAQGNDFGASLAERQRGNQIAKDQISASLAAIGWNPSTVQIMNTVLAALDAEVGVMKQARDTSVAQFDVGLLTRGAKAANDNTVSTQLAIFDQTAKLELDATRAQLVALGLAAGDVEWRINALVIAQNKERDAIKDQTDALNQQKRDQADAGVTNVIQQITQYARSLQVGEASPLSARAQYDIASRQFDTGLAAARAGDFTALQNLTSNAEVLRNASRALSGSGLGYVQTYDRIAKALESVSAMSPQALTAGAMAQIAQTNTQTMVAAINDLKSALVQIRDSINRNAYAPPASRAA